MGDESDTFSAASMNTDFFRRSLEWKEKGRESENESGNERESGNESGRERERENERESGNERESENERENESAAAERGRGEIGKPTPRLL